LCLPKSIGDALAHPSWHQVMLDEMSAFQNNGTWVLIPLPFGKVVVGCRWVFAIKISPNGTTDRFKIVAKGYTEIFGLDYDDIFSPVAKMALVC